MFVLFLIVAIDLIGFGIVIPLLPFYAEHFDASPAQVGLLMAIYSAAQFLAAPFWGQLSDRIGRRPVLLWTMAGAFCAYIWLGHAESLMSLFLARAFGGFMAGNISTAFAYVADVTTEKTRAKGMGLMGAAFSLGFILGPALGGILAGSDPLTADYRNPSYAAAALSLLALTLGFSLLKESVPAEARAETRAASRPSRLKTLFEALSMPGIGVLILMSFLATLAFAGLEATFAMWSRRQFGWGPEQNGYLFTLIGLTAALVQGGLMGRLAAWAGVERLIVGGAIVLALGLVAVPFCDTVPMLVVVMTVCGLGFSVLTPALNTAISLRGSAGVQGGLMGVTRSATTLSRMIGPAVAGSAFGLIGLNAPYIAGAAIMVLVAFIGLTRLSKRDEAEV